MKSSLYIHIPFCKSICGYCDFYSVPMCEHDGEFVNAYIDALAREFDYYLESGLLNGSNINTIYIGGGTPTVLSVGQWKKLYDVLLSKIDLSSIAEFSVECNPDSFTREHAEFFLKLGVTRLTFGVQSLNDDELKLCNRPHNAKSALEVLNNHELLGQFDSIGVDIIYALPNQTIRSLDKTVKKILSIPHVKHLSAYELTIAEDTPFGEMFRSSMINQHKRGKKIKWADQDLRADMFYQINKICYARGFGQYEVSNYAREEKYQSQHNKTYWERKPYVGLGAGAHSHVGEKRFSNIADVDKYISGLSTLSNEKKIIIDFEEVLTPAQIANEIIFLGLRYVGGIDEDEYHAKTGMRFATKNRIKNLNEFVDKELIICESKKWIPTSLGMLFSDNMSRELMN